jgi:hypothetical protein
VTDFAVRIATIKNTGVGPGNIYKLNASTMTDDNLADNMFGGAGDDWFVIDSAAPADINDAAGDEITNRLDL